ncbi:MAG TPA: hypothetical protein VHG30_12255 [Microvirga sp.]|nr:hypothetical protein [Microvirga sp.]
MIDWLHELPLVVGATLVCGLFLVPTLAGSALLQPTVGRLLRGERDANSVVGLLLNAFSLYYGVLLALLSIAVFGNYDRAKDSIGQEASSIVALYRDVSGYPEPVRTALMQTLRGYLDEETGPGWREQRRGQVASAGVRLVDELARQLSTFKPSRDSGEDALHRETLRTFNEFVERRRNRIQAGTTSIPPVIWYVVLIGAALNVLVLWMFDLKRTTHFVFGGVLTVFIGLVVYMVAVLDQPFRGSHGLSPDELIQARQQMNPR